MKAVGSYIIVSSEPKEEKNTTGFEVIVNHENKETSIGKVLSVGNLETELKVGDTVLYFDEKAVPINQQPNTYVLKPEDIFAKEEQNE